MVVDLEKRSLPIRTAFQEQAITAIHSRAELTSLCARYTPIGPQTRLSPGKDLDINKGPLGPQEWTSRIKGDYGIQMVVPQEFSYTINSRDTLVVAQLGFTLRGNGDMFISNSPQGISRERLHNRGYTDEAIHDVMKELKKEDPESGTTFRDELLESAIVAAHALKSAGIKRVVGQAAENHPKVKGAYNFISLERAKKSMNDLYVKHGFHRLTEEEIEMELDPDVDFALVL